MQILNGWQKEKNDTNGEISQQYEKNKGKQGAIAPIPNQDVRLDDTSLINHVWKEGMMDDSWMHKSSGESVEHFCLKFLSRTIKLFAVDYIFKKNL